MTYDARQHLLGLVGQTIHTLSGRPNTILRVDGDRVLVATKKSPKGQPVPMKWVQEAIDKLVEEGELAIEVPTVGYRSAFIGGVLATLPGAVVIEGTHRIRLHRGSEAPLA